VGISGGGCLMVGIGGSGCLMVVGLRWCGYLQFGDGGW